MHNNCTGLKVPQRRYAEISLNERKYQEVAKMKDFRTPLKDFRHRRLKAFRKCVKSSIDSII